MTCKNTIRNNISIIITLTSFCCLSSVTLRCALQKAGTTTFCNSDFRSSAFFLMLQHSHSYYTHASLFVNTHVTQSWHMWQWQWCNTSKLSPHITVITHMLSCMALKLSTHTSHSHDIRGNTSKLSPHTHSHYTLVAMQHFRANMCSLLSTVILNINNVIVLAHSAE